MYIEMSECGHFCTLYSVHMTAYCHHLMSLALSLSHSFCVYVIQNQHVFISMATHCRDGSGMCGKCSFWPYVLNLIPEKTEALAKCSLDHRTMQCVMHTHTHFSKHCACFSLRRNQIWMVHTKCENQDFLATFEVVWVFVSRCSGSNQIEIGWRNCPESARHRLGHFGFKEGSRPKIRMGSFSKKNHANWKNLVSEKVEDLFPNIHKNCGSESSGPPRWKNIWFLPLLCVNRMFASLRSIQSVFGTYDSHEWPINMRLKLWLFKGDQSDYNFLWYIDSSSLCFFVVVDRKWLLLIECFVISDIENESLDFV